MKTTETTAAQGAGGDAVLRRLAADLEAARSRHEIKACVVGELQTLGDHDAVEKQRMRVAKAFRAWEKIALKIAMTPAEGAAGLAVKARQVALAVTDGPTGADIVLAANLMREAQAFLAR